MTITTDSRSHVVYLDRRLVRRLEIGASARAHRGSTVAERKAAKSYSTYLEQSLRVRGDRIELKGPEHWFRSMIRVCGDSLAAFEIGRQLQGPE